MSPTRDITDTVFHLKPHQDQTLIVLLLKRLNLSLGEISIDTVDSEQE
jgi:hypothetical protein